MIRFAYWLYSVIILILAVVSMFFPEIKAFVICLCLIGIMIANSDDLNNKNNKNNIER